MAADFALIALPGAYHSSIGALTDSFLLARDRVEHVYAGPDQISMETRLRILSPDGAAVPLSDGTLLRSDGTIGEEGPFSFIWLPAFRAVSREQTEARISNAKPMLDWLRRQRELGAIIGASGAAALLLMAAGITPDVKVPVGRALQPLARALFPRQPLEERFNLVDHGNLLISSGLAGDLSLILRVFERAISPDIARWLTSIIGMDNEEDHRLAGDPLIARAQLWIEQHFTGAISLTELAHHLSTSPATLNRRFHKSLGVSPRAYVSRLRFQAATRMLEKSTRSIDVIAQLVGYSDSRLFRAMFQQHSGMTASQWREAHQAALQRPE